MSGLYSVIKIDADIGTNSGHKSYINNWYIAKYKLIYQL